jgi:DHA2 family multidrug resistance protein-like MFS transporter
MMAAIDNSVANVALPTIAKNLNVSPALAIWIINGYQLTTTIALLPLASLGEIIGHKRVYLPGLALFTLARRSARCRTRCCCSRSRVFDRPSAPPG